MLLRHHFNFCAGQLDVGRNQVQVLNQRMPDHLLNRIFLCNHMIAGALQGGLVHAKPTGADVYKRQAVQWVPGDGQPPQQAWPEVLEKLGLAGRKLLLYDGGPKETELVLRLPGIRPGQVYHSPYWIHPGQVGEYDAWLDRWGAR